jgi:hypothetical protein
LAEDLTERFRGTNDFFKHRVPIDLLAQREVLVACALISFDSIMDVSSRRIPADDPALFIQQRIELREKPSVLSILTQDSLFERKRFVPKHRLSARLTQPLDVFGMNAPEKIDCFLLYCIVDCEARIVENGLIHA